MKMNHCASIPSGHWGQFHCRYCGGYFDLDDEDQELFEDGFIPAPDCCSECSDMYFESGEYCSYSDADSGL